MRTAFLAALAALLPMAPPWIKLDEAFAAATTGDKLIAVYSTIGADGSREDGSPDADAALASKAVAARYGEYFWVRAADLATAKRIDAPSGGSNLIFLDPDGGTVGVYNIALGGEPTVLKALDDVKLAYIPKSVPWFEGEPDEKDTGLRRKLIVYAFLDEKEASEKTVKALEHPWVARDHNRLTLVRKYVLDSPLAKRFKVTSAPTLIFFDAAMKDGKQVVERKTGEVTPRMIRAPMRKFFERVKKEAATAK
jgi:hypothetical protein